MKVAIIMGTRPEIIKLSSIIKRLNSKNSVIVFTGQHYDYDMSLRFIEDLGLRKPDYSMKLTKLENTTTDRATQIGEIVLKLAKIISSTKPDTVLVQGDTNTVLAGAITALKCGIPVSHVEAGLRSYDWRMPEEHNRIAVDHISEFLFAPTLHSKKILQNEKVHGKTFVTGNTSIDAVEENIQNIENKKTVNLDVDNFALVTLHRGENVDVKESLSSIINALLKSDIDLVFPIHPRTMKRLKQFGLYEKIKTSKITILPTMGYFDMLYLMKKSRFIISDSGGIQEEATSPKIRKKVLVVRKTTDRIESIQDGYSELVGTSTDAIIQAIRKNRDVKISCHSNPYGDGKSGEKIINLLRKNL
jgi:UDP-N-acetylglucosamine 2-epimerase (non-hydrolysing)